MAQNEESICHSQISKYNVRNCFGFRKTTWKAIFNFFSWQMYSLCISYNYIFYKYGSSSLPAKKIMSLWQYLTEILSSKVWKNHSWRSQPRDSRLPPPHKLILISKTIRDSNLKFCRSPTDIFFHNWYFFQNFLRWCGFSHWLIWRGMTL
jgi:hypothetical protein